MDYVGNGPLRRDFPEACCCEEIVVTVTPIRLMEESGWGDLRPAQQQNWQILRTWEVKWTTVLVEEDRATTVLTKPAQPLMTPSWQTARGDCGDYIKPDPVWLPGTHPTTKTSFALEQVRGGDSACGTVLWFFIASSLALRKFSSRPDNGSSVTGYWINSWNGKYPRCCWLAYVLRLRQMDCSNILAIFYPSEDAHRHQDDAHRVDYHDKWHGMSHWVSRIFLETYTSYRNECLQENQGYFRCDWGQYAQYFIAAQSPVTIEDKETSVCLYARWKMMHDSGEGTNTTW